MLITTVENQVLANVVVDMDDKRFLGCEFEHCTLRYAGGECSWDKNTVFRPNCTWEIFDTAARVVNVLTRSGAISGGSFRIAV
jgi:hypothetical protein